MYLLSLRSSLLIPQALTVAYRYRQLLIVCTHTHTHIYIYTHIFTSPCRWLPGDVKEPGLKALYLAAQITVDPNGNVINPKEWRTVELFNHLTNEFAQQVLCFVEAKRTGNQTESLISDLENQARDYCRKFIHGELLRSVGSST